MKYETINLTYNWNEDRKNIGVMVMRDSSDWKVGLENLDKLEPESIYETALKMQVKKDILDAQVEKKFGNLEEILKKNCEECKKKDVCPKYQKRKAEETDETCNTDEAENTEGMDELFHGLFEALFGKLN